MSRNKLYFIVISICLAGYFWIGYHYIHTTELKVKNESNLEFCMFRSITGVPCPSCGMTRSVTTLAQGNITDALWWNPLGIIMFISMVLFPLWIIRDLVFRKNSFFIFYKNNEKFFQKKSIAILSISLILLLWIWNLKKFL